MKTLEDVKGDMSDLYEAVKAGTTDIKLASELANITGKYLKAAQLEFAKEVFLEKETRPILNLGGQETPALEAARQ